MRILIIAALTLLLVSCQTATPTRVTTLSENPESTRTKLVTIYQKELLIRDTYAKIIEKYPTLMGIGSIIKIQERNQERIGTILDQQQIARPTEYSAYSKTYDTLTKYVESGFTGAIEAGITIETNHIDTISTVYPEILNSDIRDTLQGMTVESLNDLRVFVQAAQAATYIPHANYASYLTGSLTLSDTSLEPRMMEILHIEATPPPIVDSTPPEQTNIPVQYGKRMPTDLIP
jgi:hypothetical protein